jgi:hypothetical protein
MGAARGWKDEQLPMKAKMLFALGLVIVARTLPAQWRMEANGFVDLMLSRAGEDSHYYYNGVHRDFSDWRLGLSEVNALGVLRKDEHWSLHARAMLSRRDGGRLERFSLPLLHLEWAPGKGDWRFQLGRFIHPFGNFNERQFAIDRPLVPLPFPYTYSTRISHKKGALYYPERNVPPAERYGGWPILYYGGYQTGLRVDWRIVPRHWTLSAALTNGAALGPDQLGGPLNAGFAARLAWQPGFSWQQGLSFSVGQFMRRHELNAVLPDLGNYRQTALGADFAWSAGHWEVNGELIAAWHRAPLYAEVDSQFIKTPGGAFLAGRLFNLAGYFMVKYEPPFLSGSYLSYGFDAIGFGDNPVVGGPEAWDGRAARHALGGGYKINPWLLLRSTFSWQKTQWAPGEYWTWLSTLTFHF